MTHTDGPWIIVGPSPGGTAYDDGGDYAIVNNGGIIAEAICRVDVHRYEDALANARLIAAAPDMLDACMQLVWATDNNDAEEAVNAINSARAAINKAKGITE